MVGCDMHDSSSSTIPLAAGSRDQEFVAGTWTLPVCMTTWPVFGGRSADSGCIYIGRYAEVYWGVGSEVKLSWSSFLWKSFGTFFQGFLELL